MKMILTLAWRDFRAYFTSPIAYIVIAGFMMIMGWMFFFSLSNFQQMSMQFQQFNAGKSMSITDGILRPVYGNMNVIFLLMTPLITMRLFAEEKKQHTIELLMTSPITLTQIILGKFFGAVGLVAVMLLMTSVYPIILILTGNPDVGTIVATYVGTLLLCSCYVSLGVLFSAMTENQIVAAVLTFAGGFLFWLIGWASMSAGPVWGDVFSYLSLVGHFLNTFTVGVISSSDTFYYVSFIGTVLFITHRVLDSYRWR